MEEENVLNSKSKRIKAPSLELRVTAWYVKPIVSTRLEDHRNERAIASMDVKENQRFGTLCERDYPVTSTPLEKHSTGRILLIDQIRADEANFVDSDSEIDISSFLDIYLELLEYPRIDRFCELNEEDYWILDDIRSKMLSRRAHSNINWDIMKWISEGLESIHFETWRQPKYFQMVNDSMLGPMNDQQMIFVKERLKTSTIGSAVNYGMRQLPHIYPSTIKDYSQSLNGKKKHDFEYIDEEAEIQINIYQNGRTSIIRNTVNFGILNVDNLDDTGFRMRQLPHISPSTIKDYSQSLNVEKEQEFKYTDEAAKILININQNESILSPHNLEISSSKAHYESSEQTTEEPGPQSTLWRMLALHIPVLTVLMAVYVISHHNVLVTSIVGLFFIQMFANNIYRFFFANNDETINSNVMTNVFHRALELLVPMMLIELQLAAVVMWQFHETHLAREPQLNELPSLVVLGLMTFHVLLQFNFHVIDFTRLLM